MGREFDEKEKVDGNHIKNHFSKNGPTILGTAL